MQKIWQWIRDKKSNTIRKWRSSVFGDRRDDYRFDDGLFEAQFASAGTPLLGVPGRRLEPIGGSDNVLTKRRRGQRNGTISKLTRKLTPSKMKNGKPPSAEYATAQAELRNLLLVETDDFEPASSLDISDDRLDSSSRLTDNSSYSNIRPSTSAAPTREPSLGDLYDDYDEENLGSDPAALPPIPQGNNNVRPAWRRRRSSAAAISPTNSTPGSTRMERRRLRFIIPQ
ncbi:hypothetical protein AAVH_34102, partial [Aphelenchoides avenae]